MPPIIAPRAALHWAPIALAASIACGDGHPSPTEAPVSDRGPIAALTEGRVVIAEVNGRPVFDDCVTIQAATNDIDRDAALQQCIDFELLAQVAEERGYRARPEVERTQRREAVRALIETEFAPSFDGPEDVPEATVLAYWHADRLRYDHPELRYTAHVLARVAPDVPLGSQRDLAAREVAEELHRLYAGKRWQLDEFLEEAWRYRARRTVARLRAGLEVASEGGAQPTLDAIVDALFSAASEPEILFQELPNPFPIDGGGRYARVFAAGAFAIPSVGMVSAPTRTRRFGWHVILLTKILPAEHKSFDEVEDSLRALLFERERQLAFQRWQQTLLAGKQIEVDESALARLVEAERARVPLPDPGEGGQ